MRGHLELWPQRNLDRRGRYLLLTVVAVALTAVGILNSAHVFWPVGIACVSAFSALWLALWSSDRAGHRLERIEIGPGHVRVIKQRNGALAETFDFNAGFVRIVVRSDHHVRHRILLAESGRSVEIGAFLSARERLEVAEALSERVADTMVGMRTTSTPA